jgi:hypothetical protein
MAFLGFSEEDGEPTYDTKEVAIERARQMIAWGGDPSDKIFVHRKGVPLWFAHLVCETPLQWLAYTELK